MDNDDSRLLLRTNVTMILPYSLDICHLFYLLFVVKNIAQCRLI